jgi:histidine ammonia-lyase
MININGNTLSLEEIIRVSRFKEKVMLDSSCLSLINQSSKQVQKILRGNKPVYGINTGFGIFSNKPISIQDSQKLNRNLILSHAIGFGDLLPREIIRAAILIRANTLAKGFSGVQLNIIETLISMLNADLTPLVKSQGSLGSSGDLCMLSQLALVFTKDKNDLEEESGKAWLNDALLSGKKAMQKAGIQRIELGAKEGLAIINGPTFSAAFASITLWDSLNCLQSANSAASISLEAIQGQSSAFDSRLQLARGLPGQIIIAQEISKKISGSSMINNGNQVQDPYSFRCVPQVHGAIFDTLNSIKEVVQKEINAATDNPLIFAGDVISGGNFHGESLAMNMDFLSIAMTELSAISERRIFLLLDENLNNGLPPMLVDEINKAGLNSGIMISQYTAASLVLENRTLATPDSVQSLPTSANQEDHNANALTAAKHAYEIVKNTFFVIAIELFTAARAIDIRMKKSLKLRLGIGTQKTYQAIRNISQYYSEDTLWINDIDQIHKALIKLEIP